MDGSGSTIWRLDKALNQAVRRNLSRFPEDFMFQLSQEETDNLRSQFVTSTGKQGGRRYLPYAFTEQGIAMLSSVLKSNRAVEVNIAIMRTFVLLRRLMDSNRELQRKIEKLVKRYDEQFGAIFQAIKQLVSNDAVRRSRPKRRIGYLPEEE